mgnify:FL=1
MLKKSIFVFMVLIGAFACTQLLDENNLAESTYTGNDGCIYCHTSEARLKVLAQAEEEDHGGGGG